MRRMLPPSRSRRIAKWTGLVVCVVLLAWWPVSAGMCFANVGYSVGGWTDGAVQFGRADDSLTIGAARQVPHVGRFAFPLPEVFRLGQYGFMVTVPFWLLLTLVAIPTAILWHRDRRTVKPGCCRQCGYDLRASKKTCPECGAVVTSDTR